MQLSQAYFERFHASYHIKRPVPESTSIFESDLHAPMFNIVHRCNVSFVIVGYKQLQKKATDVVIFIGISCIIGIYHR